MRSFLSLEVEGWARFIAPAIAGLANCYAQLCLTWNVRADTLGKADAASRKALELAPHLAEAHVARGVALSIRRQFAEAQTAFETAINLDPNLFEARYLYGRACLSQGRLAEAATTPISSPSTAIPASKLCSIRCSRSLVAVAG
jgi:tetratricopeptide (TPR) repeat protein